MPAVAQSTGAGQTGRSPKARVFVSLLLSFLLIITVLVAAFGFILHSWQDALRSEIERSLTQKTQMFAAEVNNEHAHGIVALTSQAGQRAGTRATVIDMNGKVIADSEVRVADLKDEARHPEFVAALHGDTGMDVRSRSMFGIPVLYIAVPVSGGAVRLAYPLADIAIATSHVTRMLGLALILAIVVAVAISALLTKFLLHSATIISSVAN